MPKAETRSPARGAAVSVLSLSEAGLISLGVGFLLLVEATAIAAVMGGFSYVSALRGEAGFVIAARYAAIFAAAGCIGWALARLAFGYGRSGCVFVVLLCLSAPVLNGVLATRAPLEAAAHLRGVQLLAVAGGAAVLFALGRAARGRPGLRRAVLFFLLAGPAVLGGLNSLNLFRLTAELATVGGLLGIVGVVAAASLGVTPFWTALRDPERTGSTPGLVRAAAAYLLVFALLVWSAPGAPDSRPGPGLPSRPPSILLIVVDTLRADALGALRDGAPLMPKLRAFARDATEFSRAYAAAPWTTPSVASLLTSVWPSEHQAGRRDPHWSFKHALDGGVPTLPSLLAEHGYWTGAVLTNSYLGPRYGLARGFEVYENFAGAEWYHPLLIGAASRGLLSIRPYVPAPEQTMRALGLLERGVASGRPVFALVHYMDPHRPYTAHGPGAADASLEARYRAEAAYLDVHLGELLDALRARGLYDELLIVLTADHGEQIAEPREDGSYDHGHTLFEELLRVPLLIKLPGGEGGGERRTDPASLVDIAPTLLARAEIPSPAGFRGSDLFGSRSDLAGRTIFAEGLLYGSEQKAGIREGEKVIVSPDDGRARAYDLIADPLETTPLDPGEPRFAALWRQVESFAASHGEAGTAPRAEEDVALHQRLSALGYVD